MTDTAVAGPQSGTTAAELAARHGLHVAGARPSMTAYVRQLWAYRSFIGAYATGRLVAQFSQARLGRVWQVLNPLTNAAVYFLIFGVVLNTRHGVPNFTAYLCTGVFIFTYTQTTVQSGVQAISGHIGLVRALHFPRASLPISTTITQLQNLIASMVVLAGIVLATREPVTFNWLLLVPALLLQTVFNTGLALAFARLGSKIADLKQVVPFLLRTWMYMSGVMYATTLFAAHLPGWAVRILTANPLLVYIELARNALLKSYTPASSLTNLWVLGVVWAIVVIAAGFVYFWRAEKEYGRG